MFFGVSSAVVAISLQERCPSLEVLEVNNCLVSNDSLVLNIEKLQAGCPKLKIIRMANTRVSSRACSQRDRVGVTVHFFCQNENTSKAEELTENFSPL